MHKFLLITLALSTIAASYQTSSTGMPTKVTTLEEIDLSTTMATQQPISTINFIETVTSLKPIINKNDTPAVETETVKDQFKRRIVSYDQRQEGQYNIRADLENFMIVLIPPGPQEGLNLLDLLTKSSLRRASDSIHTTKSKRKHFGTRTTLHSIDGNNNYHKLHSGLKSTKTHLKASQPVSILETHNNNHNNNNDEQHMPEFIEGRTPYHVDISANDEDQSRLQTERQVDVLPPPYYPQLIKPYHLEAEPTIIQALPPAEVAYNQLLLDDYNRALSNNVAVAVAGTDAGKNYYRTSRAIQTTDNFMDTNRLNGIIGKRRPTTRTVNVPIYRADLGIDTVTNGLYPPIDAPQLHEHERPWHVVNGASVVDADNGEIASRRLDGHALNFDLLNDATFDETKLLLLSDSLERCAPGKRRDSYGICRQIEGY